MIQVYRILGQLAPGATTLSDLYTVTSPVKSSIISSLNVTNRAGATTFRLAIRKGGASISNEMYLAYDAPIAANDVMSFNIGISLATGDVISVYGGSANLSFSAFGLENS